MKKFITKLLVSGFLIISSSSYAAGAAELTGVKGTIKNIDKPIRAAVEKAEALFEQNAGASLSSSMNLLNSGGSAFITNLTIGTGYDINLTFAGTSGTAFTSSSTYDANAKTPIAKALAGSKIRLIPIYTIGDNSISSWECITNADTQAVAFMGSKVSANEGNTSFISTNGNNNDNEYLSNCIYVANVDSAFGGSGGGGGSSGSGSGSGSGAPAAAMPFINCCPVYATPGSCAPGLPVCW